MNQIKRIDADNFNKYSTPYQNQRVFILSNPFKCSISEGTFKTRPDIISLILRNFVLQIENSYHLFTSLSNLTHLSLFDFNFTFDKKYIGGLKKLCILILMNCEINMEDDFFSNNSEVKLFSLKNTNLKEFRSEMIRNTKIEDITLSENKYFNKIIKNSFILPTLRKIDISLNEINMIEENTFSPLVEKIDLRYNKLKHISSDIFPRLNNLNLSENKYLVIDDIEKLKEKVNNLKL